MKHVDIYTDGACSGNPGPGGYGAILVYQGKEKELCGGQAQTTNNRMELTAAIAALKALKEPCQVTLYSDSQYLVNGFQKGWVYQWEQKNWVKSDKKPVLNVDLWQELLQLFRTHQVELVWVRGHAGHPQNERCDRLAVSQVEKFRLGAKNN